jgi:hypothetical protein
LVLLSGLAAGAVPAPEPSAREVRLDGRLRVAHVDDFAKPYMQYMIELEDTTTYVIQGPDTSLLADVDPGTLISIDGWLGRDSIRLDADPEVRVLGPSDEPVNADGYNPDNFGQQDQIGLMTNFRNDQSKPLTTQQISDVMSTNGDKIFKEFSYDQMWLSTNVSDWQTAQIDATCSNNNILQPAVDAHDPSVNFAPIDRITIIFVHSGCSYGGVAILNKRNINTDEGTIRASVLWIPSKSWGLGVWAHEKGHNYGVLHAAYLNCNGQDLGQVGDQNSCTSEEYGDPWDTMGNAGGRMHYDTYHKRKIGWLAASKTFIATTKKGIFDIEPVEKMPADLGELQVPWDGTIYLTLEFRQPIGYDAGKTGNLYKGVVMHLAPWSRSGGGGGSDSHLVDVNPSGSTKTDAALEPGRTWTAPSKGIEITVISVSATAAKVRLGPASNDSTAPDIAITSPKDGEALPSTSVAVTGTSSDNVAVQQVDVQVNNGAWAPATGTTSWSAQVTVPAGTSTICARAIDTSGNFKTSSPCPKVTVDASPPKVDITSPADGTQASQADIAVSGTSSDDTKVDKVEVAVNNGAWTLATGTTSWSAQVTLSEGGNSICAKATDGAAKSTTSKCVNVGFDKTPPAVAITDPKDGAVVNLKDYTVRGTSSDNQGVVSVEVQANAGAWTPANGTNSWTALVPLNEGANTLCAQAKDKAGLSAATSPCSKVTLDTTPPAIAFTAPSPGTTVPAEALTVSGTASDNVKVERVELRVGTGGWFKATGTDSWTVVLNLPAAGVNKICARGVDSGGNVGDGSTCLEVTALAPRALKEVRIDPTSVDLEPGGVVKFTAQALDAEGAELPADAVTWRWQVSEGSGKIDSDGTFTAPRNVGKNRVVVTATFRGESKTAIAEVSVKSSVDVGGLMGQLWLPLLLALVAVIALVAAAMALRSKRRRKSMESGDYWANYK